MAEEIAFKNGRIPNFQGLVTSTSPLDRVILHTVVHHSLTPTYIPNFTEIKETFCGWTDVHTDGRTFDIHFISGLRRVDLIRSYSDTCKVSRDH